MKYRFSLCISALCFLTAFLIALTVRQQGNEALATRIAPEILRFHILANSDSSADQQLKMEVKGLVIDYVNENLGSSATKNETVAWLMDHKPDIETMAADYIRSQGKDYPVTLALTKDYFPTKAYGDMVFPCGTYDAARITIGSGSGHNWWCVLYPPLCYVDSMNAVVPESSKQTLKTLIPDDDYQALLPENERIKNWTPTHSAAGQAGSPMAQAGSPEAQAGNEKQKPQIRVKFRLLELLSSK